MRNYTVKKIAFVIFMTFCVMSTALTGEMFSYGKYWSLLPPLARSAYLDGVMDGSGYAYFEAAAEWLPSGELTKKPEPASVVKVRKKVFLMVNRDSIIEVMTDLYRDPANTFIDTKDILFIARDKLLGKSIDDRLVSARKQAVEFYEQVQKLEMDKRP